MDILILKNLSRSVKMHEALKDHINNCLELVCLEINKDTIVDALNDGARLCKTVYNENVRKNRLELSKIIDVVLLLGEQEMAFRRHDESSTSINKSNFREVFNLVIQQNEELFSHYNNVNNVFTGHSNTIQNEVIHCIYKYILDEIKSDINYMYYFLLLFYLMMVVEKSQCAITLRYVKNRGIEEKTFFRLNS